jgi:mannose-6-phosphate isomerase-like protein (cupin superfamily)
VKESFRWDRPVFKHSPFPGFTRGILVSPETCPTKSMSVFICSFDRRKMKLSNDSFDVHEGFEEGYYGIKGRMKMFTPNETWTLSPGKFVWIPAGMPHGGRPLDQRVVFMAIFAPARSGREKNVQVTAQQAGKIAKRLTKPIASWHPAI